MNYDRDIDDDDSEADADAAFHPTENERFPGIFLSPQDYADAFAIRTAKAKVGRPSERFYLRWPHPLADTHVIVRKAKTDILALAGHGPPKYSDDPAKKGQFCLYYASNYKPWIFHPKSPRPDVSVPAFVDYYRRLERGACLYGPRERDPDPNDSPEAAFQQKCAYRARCIAAGRLFTINTAVSALETDSAVAAMTRAIRARSRDLWEYKKKPEEEKAENDGSRSAVLRELRKMQEHQDRLQNAPAIGTRLQRAVTLQAVGDAINDSLPSIGSESDVGASKVTPQQLQGSFRGAFEARQRREHPRRKYTRNPAAVVAALKEALPPQTPIRPTQAEARRAYGDIMPRSRPVVPTTCASPTIRRHYSRAVAAGGPSVQRTPGREETTEERASESRRAIKDFYRVVAYRSIALARGKRRRAPFHRRLQH